MNYALLIYTVVAMSGQNADLAQARDWRYLTTHYSLESCQSAAKSMGIASERYRCVGVK